MFSLDDYHKQPKSFVINSSLGYVCLSLLPYLAFIHVQRCSIAARRKLSSVAGLFVASNCMGPPAAPGKETAWYCLQTPEVPEDGEARPRNLGCLFLRDTGLTVSQQQFKPGAISAAKLSFTAIAKKKLRLHDCSEGWDSPCAFTVWAAAAPRRAVLWNALQCCFTG